MPHVYDNVGREFEHVIHKHILNVSDAVRDAFANGHIDFEGLVDITECISVSQINYDDRETMRKLKTFITKCKQIVKEKYEEKLKTFTKHSPERARIEQMRDNDLKQLNYIATFYRMKWISAQVRNVYTTGVRPYTEKELIFEVMQDIEYSGILEREALEEILKEVNEFHKQVKKELKKSAEVGEQ